MIGVQRARADVSPRCASRAGGAGEGAQDPADAVAEQGVARCRKLPQLRNHIWWMEMEHAFPSLGAL